MTTNSFIQYDVLKNLVYFKGTPVPGLEEVIGNTNISSDEDARGLLQNVKDESYISVPSHTKQDLIDFLNTIPEIVLSDSSAITLTIEIINNITIKDTYVVSVNIDGTKTYTTNISVSPQLPSGTTITLNLQHVNLFKASPTPNIASATTVSTLYKNSVPYTATTNSTTTATTLSTKAGCNNLTPPVIVYNKTYLDNWSSVTITRTDSLSIYTVTSVYKNNSDNCYIGEASDDFNKSALTISGNCVNCVAQ
jgi:hypothetical protein